MSIGDSRLSRRQFLQLAALAGAGGLLAACGGGAAEPSEDAPGGDVPAKDPVVIQHWVFWGQLADCVDAWEATDELAEALGDNTWDFKTGMGGDTAKTAVAGGTPPDIGTLGSYLDYMSRGVLIAIDDWVASDDVIKPDMFISANWEMCQYRGKQYGVPAYEGFVRRGLNYNARMVEEAGLDPDNPPHTWDETFVWHQALTKFDAAGNLTQIGLDPNDAEGGTGPGNDGWGLGDSWDVRYFDSESQTFDLDNEFVAEGLEVMGEFVKLAGPDNLQGLRQVEGQGTWGGAFNAEVQAMIIEGYWHGGETLHEKPEVAEQIRCSWAPVPTRRKNDKIQTGGGHMAQFFKDAKNQQEAWPLVRWINSNACCNIIFETIGWLPANADYIRSVDTSTVPGLDFYVRSIDEATHMYGPVQCEIEAFVQTKYQEAREAVYRGTMTGKEAAAMLQAAAEEEWEAAGFN
jgi:ABC-type glycerol-3-phosphate transport system substrate-binding protein